MTRLLVSIKALLETLTAWSQSKKSENDVSDVYVRLGNDFNAAVAAFGSFRIDMACVFVHRTFGDAYTLSLVSLCLFLTSCAAYLRPVYPRMQLHRPSRHICLKCGRLSRGFSRDYVESSQYIVKSYRRPGTGPPRRTSVDLKVERPAHREEKQLRPDPSLKAHETPSSLPTVSPAEVLLRHDATPQ